mmetsp:Transcript_3060/g.10234  ORF Transcript_3060/g.10234 Transcript_3060/m.10234 type:complete len:204 (-) Transcript_3060:732-1343(-)
MIRLSHKAPHLLHSESNTLDACAGTARRRTCHLRRYSAGGARAPGTTTSHYFRSPTASSPPAAASRAGSGHASTAGSTALSAALTASAAAEARARPASARAVPPTRTAVWCASRRSDRKARRSGLTPARSCPHEPDPAPGSAERIAVSVARAAFGVRRQSTQRSAMAPGGIGVTFRSPPLSARASELGGSSALADITPGRTMV